MAGRVVDVIDACTLRAFEKDVQRAVIQNFNLAMLTVTFGGYLAAGIALRDMLPLFAVSAARRRVAGSTRAQVGT